MDTIYVVSYSTGEYSDRCDWPAAWYETKEAADAHVAWFRGLLVAARESLPLKTGVYSYEHYPHTDATRAFYDMLGQPQCEKVFDRDLWNYNPPDVTEVPRGTLALHGLTETR